MSEISQNVFIVNSQHLHFLKWFFPMVNAEAQVQTHSNFMHQNLGVVLL